MTKVLVTGATGATGFLVTQKLAARKSQFIPVAGVRSVEAKKLLQEKLSLPDDQVKVLDICQPADQAYQQLKEALTGCKVLVVVTSAQVEMVPKPADAPPGPPTFVWKGGLRPEQVDYLGQKVQIDAAKDAGVQHVVVVGSRGGTQKDSNLNKLGDNGNILQWKRKAETYLIASGIPYTIIHPGGLINEAGGERELVLTVDDIPIKADDGNEYRSVPRADVAEVCVQSLLLPQYLNRSFDLISKPPGVGTVTTDFGKLIDSLEGKSCDYSLNPV